jgi:hypothetical protein
MNAINKGHLLLVLVCCVNPILFHLLMKYGLPYIVKRDWSNPRWDAIEWPWRKKQ